MVTNDRDQEAPYGDVDRAEDATRRRLIRFLDTQNESRDIQRGKKIVLEELNIQPSWTVLDAGSGLGHDLVDLGRLVGPTGRAVGIDFSRQMIDEAKRRLEGLDLPIEMFQADVTDLPFEDAMFDAVRSERVFQHLSDIGAGLDELLRVTKPGGRIAIFDTDHASIGYTVGEPELESRVAEFWGQHPGSTNIRRVPAVMANRRMVDITIRPQIVFAGPAEWTRLMEVQGGQHPGLIDAHHRGILDNYEYDRLIDAQARAIENGTFFSYAVMLIVAGTKASK